MEFWIFPVRMRSGWDQGVLALSRRDENHDGSSGELPDALSFEELVVRARRGDQDAAGVLVQNYRNYLLFLANEDVGPDLRAKVGASDAVQESMMHAQMNLNQFRGNTESEWKAWLRTILVNDIRKNRRKFAVQKRDAKREVNIQDHSAVGRGLLDEHLTPSREAIQQEKKRAMIDAMARLNDEQQQVIQLRNFEQLSFEQIGDQMNRSPDAARKLWARSIEVLKLGLKSISPELVDDRNESPNPDE